MRDETNNGSEIIFPGSKPLSERAKEIDVDKEAERIVEARANFDDLKLTIPRITQPFFVGFRNVALHADSRTRLVVPGRRKGHFIAPWSDEIITNPPVNVNSELYFDKDKAIDFPILRSYLAQFVHKGGERIADLDILFGPDDISKMILRHYPRYGFVDDINHTPQDIDDIASRGKLHDRHQLAARTYVGRFLDVFYEPLITSGLLIVNLLPDPRLTLGWKSRLDSKEFVFAFDKDMGKFVRHLSQDEYRNLFASKKGNISVGDFGELLQSMLDLLPSSQAMKKEEN